MKKNAFTLIELSIVLVIIGLIVGGVLAGQSLIRSAKVRATITQVQKYNQAANTFRGKYGYLPGDIKDPDASRYGFAPRGQYAGEGDGNGIIEGISSNAPAANFGNCQDGGETLLFWQDLSAARLIDGAFSSASATVTLNGGPAVTANTSPSLDAYLPAAKLGGGNYFYVWSGGQFYGGTQIGYNLFSFSSIYSLAGPSTCGVMSNPGLTVSEAYSIDAKVDDGLPQYGNVTATYLTGVYFPRWAAGGGASGAQSASYGPTTAATPGSSTTCYDNGGGSGNQQYSIEISNGTNVNCALSFRFQ